MKEIVLKLYEFDELPKDSLEYNGLLHGSLW